MTSLSPIDCRNTNRAYRCRKQDFRHSGDKLVKDMAQIRQPLTDEGDYQSQTTPLQHAETAKVGSKSAITPPQKGATQTRRRHARDDIALIIEEMK
ncbi:MAG: hypothetical protein U0892_03030 [Pirellulales bacterium]